MTLRAVLFDLDGTLLDTLQDLTAAINRTLAAAGYPTRTEKEVRRMVGNGTRLLVRRALPAGTDEATIDRMLETYVADYGAHCLDRTAPYPGILAMLRRVKATGAAMFVISNKNEEETRRLVDTLFGKDTFTGVFGVVPGRPVKPAPDGCFAALASIGCSPEEAVFVGDSEVDARTAQNAGVYALGVTWGFRDPEELQAAGIPETVDTPEALADRLIALFAEKS